MFSLSNDRISYLFRVSQEGFLEHLHFGSKVAPAANYPSQPKRLHRGCVLEFQASKYYNLSDVPQEYPVFGTSDNRHPALHMINASGNSTQVFRYVSYQIVSDKPALHGLPSARGGNSQSLIISLVDEVTDLAVELSYTVYDEHDVVARSNRIINNSEARVTIAQAMSSCLDLPAADYDLLHLKGTWARELNQDRMPVPQGRFVIESSTGTSGNVHNPFIALMDRSANEQQGRVFATAFVYSGSFAISVEQGEFDSVRITTGINPFNFQWHLDAGESFTTPESLQVFSDAGINGMSQIWHKFIKEKISPEQFKGQPRPTYLNSWEAAYFDIDEKKVLELADRTKSLGLQMLVVDDGWFEGRDDDTTSLGDWYSDKVKFPNGIATVAGKVKAKGLKFGLWYEPEMVNPESQLYRDHPDWIIGVPNRISSKGRNQLILDLSRDEVQSYLFERIDSVLSSGNIDYVKWDMNRSMTEIGSACLPIDRQLETPHRYMLGLYRLIDKIVTKHPTVLFENCASGGNRFDLGMLHYMSQGWVSDMSEPIGRLPIINGASHLFPPCVLASYICPVPSHLNGRQVSLKTRAEVGFFCAARGLSLNAEDVEKDFEALRHYAKLYRDSADDVVNGQFYRVQYEENQVVWQLNSADGNTVYLGYFHILSAANLPFRKARLLRLDATSQYSLLDKQSAESSVSFGGDALMNMGLDMPYVCAMQPDPADYLEMGDFASRLFVFKKTS
ncbi:MAG: alpha-galactosidase [Arenicella sp.]|jgi:alpha-galactosidase